MFTVDGRTLRCEDVRLVAEERVAVTVDEAAVRRAEDAWRLVTELSARREIYGRTTGVGANRDLTLDEDSGPEHGMRLLRSHAGGARDLLPVEHVRAMMLIRLNQLAAGGSGVHPRVLTALAEALTSGAHPRVHGTGAIGTGDLTVLAETGLTLAGERPWATGHLPPVQLDTADALAFMSSNAATLAQSALACLALERLLRASHVIAALSYVALGGSPEAYATAVHAARPHPGQIDTAANLRTLMQGSRLTVNHRDLRDQVAQGKQDGAGVHRTDIYLQKAYSLRAIPQILGAVRDTLSYAVDKLTIELNSANDNPLFFPGQEIFHGANFHGQPIAFAMDYMTIALTQLGVLSERQTNRVLNRHLSYGLPEFLVKGDPGLNSGFAGAQYPATALVAENRTIGPASTQSVPSNGDNQDVVSMGLISARNARRVLQNNNKILAVEFLAAAQAVDISGRYDQLSPASKATYEVVRSIAPTLDHDRYMSDEIEAVSEALAEGRFLQPFEDSDIELR